MGGGALFFTGRGGAGRGKAKNLRAGAGSKRGLNLRGLEGAGVRNMLRLLDEIKCKTIIRIS